MLTVGGSFEFMQGCWANSQTPNALQFAQRSVLQIAGLTEAKSGGNG